MTSGGKNVPPPALVSLGLGVQSKAERGYELARSPGVPVVKADPILLTTDITSAKALQGIAGSCIRHFRLNETILLKGDDAGALHQDYDLRSSYLRTCALRSNLTISPSSPHFRKTWVYGS